MDTNNIEITSFLKTIKSSDINFTSITNNIQNKDIDEIICKYIDIKNQINTLLKNKL